MTFKSWYLDCYLDAGEPSFVAKGGTSESIAFRAKMQDEYRRGLTFQPLVPEDGTLDGCLLDVENQIYNLVYCIDHVASEKTMSGDYELDISFRQGMRAALKALGAVSAFPPPKPEPVVDTGNNPTIELVRRLRARVNH